MSNEINVQEIIAELDKIDMIRSKIINISESCDYLVSVQNKKEMEEATEKTIKILEEYQETQENKLSDIIPKLSTNIPDAPLNHIRPPKSANHNLSILTGLASLFLLYLSVLGAIIGYIMNSNIATILWFGLIAITVFMNIKFPFSNAMQYLKWYQSIPRIEESLEEWENKFNEAYSHNSNDNRYAAFQEYDSKFLSMVECCNKKYEEENTRHKEEIEQIAEKNRQKLDDLCQEKNSLIDELSSTTLIPEELYFYAWRISSMLKQKRADSLKEAINLALDEKRKEEEEEERRKEAARREAILEQQAYDNRMHNVAMQRVAEEEARAARAHNAAIERAAQAQARAAEAQAIEAQKQTQMATQQARNAENAARSRCNACANSGKCSVKFGQGAIGCPSYRPR